VPIARRSPSRDDSRRDRTSCAAISLARLERADGRPAEGRARLAEISAWFTEGFETADYASARTLLDELGLA